MTSLTYSPFAASPTVAGFTDKPPVARTLAAGIFMAVAGFGGLSVKPATAGDAAKGE
jgi:hypothetical protein